MIFRKAVFPAVVAGSLIFQFDAIAIDYYVSTAGDDSNAGSMAEPFATLSRALLAVRSVLPTAEDEINVWVRGGNYYLGNTLEFGTADSGSPTVPVTYSGYSNETVIISGAVPLSPVWSIYSGNIMEANIGTGLDFDMLFMNDDLQVLARYPNYETNTVLNGYASDAISDARASGWTHPETGLVRGLHSSRWGGNSFKISGMSGGSVALDWVGDNNRGSGLHSTYRIVENVFEELDAPGEWFYDGDTGILYFYPPDGVDPATASFEAASLEELIRVVGTASEKVQYLTFRNFTFTGTRRTLFSRPYEPLQRSDWCVARAGTIFMQDAENITVSDSTFDRVGGNAVFISGYNRNHLITNNEFLENGATCVNVVGSTNALRHINTWDDFITDAADITGTGPLTDEYPKDITISYNHMQDNGRFEKQTCGVNISMAEGITVSHNTIHGSPRAGLNICDGTWGGHILEYNDVFDCVKETSDHGPFNAWGRDRFYSIGGYVHDGSAGLAKHPYALYDAWKTTIIRNNRFQYDEPTSYGVDLDDGSSNYEIYNNLLLNAQLKLREGFDRTVYNNIQINMRSAFQLWYDQCRDVFTNNIVVADSPYNTGFISSSRADDLEAVLDRNLFYNFGETVSVGDSGWAVAGWDVNSVVADPLFLNPAFNNYTLASNSPALALGFINIPMDQFGKPGAPEPDPVDFASVTSPLSDAEPLMGGTIASVYDMGVQSALGAPDMNGVFFETLEGYSYAAGQGFELHDLIRSVNGTDITTKQSFWLIYNAIEPGSVVSIELLRNQHSADFSFVKTTGQEQLNDTAGVVYTGEWSVQEDENFFNGDLQTTTNAGDEFEITFYGADISFKSMLNTNSGNVDIYIDGVYDQTVNGYAASPQVQQTVYTKTGLADGLHTLRVVNAEAKSMSLDSFCVGPPAVVNVQVATSQYAAGAAPSVSSTDLAQTHYLSSSATGGNDVETDHAELFNGTAGDEDGDTADSGEVSMDSGNTITLQLDTDLNPLGYDITGINTVFGWKTSNGGRANQGYEVLLVFVDGSVVSLAGPEHWEPNSPATYWTEVSFTADAANGVMASGVKSIIFDITEDANAGGIVVGREFDVFGTATIDPDAPSPNGSTNVAVTTTQSDTAPVMSTTDLAQTQYLSSSASGDGEVSTQHNELFNGEIGTDANDTSEPGVVTMAANGTVTVNLDISEHTLGYSLTEIKTCFGWNKANGGRSNQGYEIVLGFVSGGSLTLAGPEHWEPNAPASYWTTVAFSDGDGGVLAHGVKSVTFNITEEANAGGVVVAREFDIFGVPYAPAWPDNPEITFIGDPSHLSWASESAALYSVQKAGSLMDADWTTFTNVVGTPPQTTVELPQRDQDTVFYRVIAE